MEFTSEQVIKEFLIKMRTQDNRATAFPFYYTIKTRATQLVPDGLGEYRRYYLDDCEYDSEEEVRESLSEQGLTSDQIDRAMRKCQEFDVKDIWIQKGMFLTEEDAERHLKVNHYHYSHDAFTYVDHAWRAPLMEEFFKALFIHFDIDNLIKVLNESKGE